ncbi:unnamed protein product [Lactuca virosa]|uniref:DUF4283 domain-containing protein n=1 Tax=Lactuca virosa TaxID=75947 RepID=A0AAU9MC67_9ASTR|nr:unnamed protein product [Lactuca virosa]
MGVTLLDRRRSPQRSTDNLHHRCYHYNIIQLLILDARSKEADQTDKASEMNRRRMHHFRHCVYYAGSGYHALSLFKADRHPRVVKRYGVFKPLRPPVRQPIHAGQQRDSRTFAEVARGNQNLVGATNNPIITLSSIHELNDWVAKDVLVGEAKCFDSLCNFPSLVALEGYDVVETKYLGGMQILIKFKSDGAARIFKSNKSKWLRWFSWVEPYGKKCARYERIAWLKITGIPFLAWDESNFTAIAGNFGKVLVNASPVWNCSDVSHGNVCILTAIQMRINEVLETTVSGSVLGSSDEEDDGDGVSYTWHQDGMDLEDGEIEIDRNLNCDRGGGSPIAPAVPIDGGTDETIQSTNVLEVDESQKIKEGCTNRLSAMVDSHAGINYPHNKSSDLGMNLNEAGRRSDDLVIEEDSYIGPCQPEPNSLPGSNKASSSPDFELGDSALKRRRTKFKKASKNQGEMPQSSIPLADQHSSDKLLDKNPLSSIDLNRCDSPSHTSGINGRNTGSPSHSSSYSTGLLHTVDVGNQVGFQVEMGSHALLDVVNGGGVKRVSS